ERDHTGRERAPRDPEERGRRVQERPPPGLERRGLRRCRGGRPGSPLGGTGKHRIRLLFLFLGRLGRGFLRFGRGGDLLVLLRTGRPERLGEVPRVGDLVEGRQLALRCGGRRGLGGRRLRRGRLGGGRCGGGPTPRAGACGGKLLLERERAAELRRARDVGRRG